MQEDQEEHETSRSIIWRIVSHSSTFPLLVGVEHIRGSCTVKDYLVFGMDTS